MTPDSRKTRGHKDEDDVVSSSSNTSSVAEKAKTRKTPAQVKAESNARKARVILKNVFIEILETLRKSIWLSF
jgi:hypothetical protein